MKSLFVATIESMFAISGVLGVLITSASAKVPDSWENLKPSYEICQKKPVVNFLNSSSLSQSNGQVKT